MTKTELNAEELKWINVYNVGDTLVFKEDGSGEMDTSIIVKKEIYYPPYTPLEVHDRYLPQHAEVKYKNKYLQYSPDGDELVGFIKRKPNKETVFHISYLYRGFIDHDLTIGSLKKKKKGRIYEFNVDHPRAESAQPKVIYWHEDYGIIKYITHGGVEWKRINLKDSSFLNDEH